MSPRRNGASAASTASAAAPAPQPALAPVPAPAAAPPAPAPRTRTLPRRISAEVVKAETRLLALERRRAASLDHHERTWADKRMTLVASFPADVRAALSAMGILPEPIDDEPVHKTNGAAAPESEAQAVTPLHTASAPAAAPAESPPAAANEEAVDLVELHEALAQIDSAWAVRGTGKRLEEWTEAQRREALTWATACIDDGPFALQSRRPAHTVLVARKGED